MLSSYETLSIEQYLGSFGILSLSILIEAIFMLVIIVLTIIILFYL